MGRPGFLLVARSGSSDQRPCAVGGVVLRERKTAPVCNRRGVRALSGLAM